MANRVHAVGTIIENKEGKILVLRRHKNDPEGNTWGLVGGKIDPGENKKQSAVREIKEEIGLAVNPANLVFIQTYHWDREDLDILFEVFKLISEEVRQDFILPKNEITNLLWETPTNLIKRNDLMLGLYDILKTQYVLN